MDTTRGRVKRIGGRWFAVALGVFLIAVLAMAGISSGAKADPTSGKTAALISSTTDGCLAALISTGGTFCIVDDSNHNQIRFDSSGNYEFTNCSTISLCGVGSFTMRGSTITLRDVKSDRRLELSLDTSMHKASMGLALFSPPRVFSIVDRNTANDVCGCGDS